jgi:glycosyltransferase involved in cell wall biosynthesis
VSFYNLIDVLVLPSVDPLEAFGMVQLEALFCRTPVVVSDLPGVREVVRKTGYGALIQKRDPQDIADKIFSLLDNPVSVKREGLVLFDYERSIDSYETLFSQRYNSVEKSLRNQA